MKESFPSPIKTPSPKESDTQEDLKRGVSEKIKEESVPGLEESIRGLEQSVREPTKEELSLLHNNQSLKQRFDKLRRRITASENFSDPDLAFHTTSMAILGAIAGIGILFSGDMTVANAATADAVMLGGVVLAPAVHLFVRAVASTSGFFAEHEKPGVHQEIRKNYGRIRNLHDDGELQE